MTKNQLSVANVNVMARSPKSTQLGSEKDYSAERLLSVSKSLRKEVQEQEVGERQTVQEQ